MSKGAGTKIPCNLCFAGRNLGYCTGLPGDEGCLKLPRSVSNTVSQKEFEIILISSSVFTNRISQVSISSKFRAIQCFSLTMGCMCAYVAALCLIVLIWPHFASPAQGKCLFVILQCFSHYLHSCKWLRSTRYIRPRTAEGPCGSEAGGAQEIQPSLDRCLNWNMTVS